MARKTVIFSLHLAERFVRHSGYPHTAALLGGPGLGDEDSEWKKVSEGGLDKYIEKHIDSHHHLTNSCRMAKREEGGVVDDKLRVSLQ